MKPPLGDLFVFSKKERLGIVFLGSIILVMLLFLNFSYLLESEMDYSTKRDLEQELIALRADMDTMPSSFSESKGGKKTKSYKKKSEPFDFDPNTIDKSGLVRLGFSEKQAASILNYREKGGVIKRVEDFKKIYVVNDYMYTRLAPYIKIDGSTLQANASEKRVEKWSNQKPTAVDRQDETEGKNVASQDFKPKKSSKVPLDLNSASRQELIDLPGIGPVYSSNILKYKALLGGYSSTSQIAEVYGIRDHPEIIEMLLPLLRVDQSLIEPRNVNTDDWITLVKHPYIDKQVANSIIAVRETHGAFTTIEDVQKSHLVTPDLFAKIAPYLTTDEHR